jgi:hypothetical protein
MINFDHLDIPLCVCVRSQGQLVVRIEAGVERIDVGQRHVVQRHVADQLPQEVTVQRRGVTCRGHQDVFKGELFQGGFGVMDVADLKPTRKVLIRAGQIDRHRLRKINVLSAEAQVGVHPVMGQ